MELDPVLLSRIQFAWAIAFHILLPALTVGLACYIALLEGLWFWTGEAIWFRISSFWIRIFAVSFGLGVVSGVVMPFQFGTNWSAFTDATADVIGPLMAYEVLTAFFLEAGALGVLLFGRKLAPPWAHVLAAALIAVGTVASSFWILAVNSWMQTPVGHEIVDGRYFPADWAAVIFSPSFPYRLAHTLTAFMIAAGLVVTGVAAGYLRAGRHLEESRRMFSMTLWLLTLLVPAQIVIGDLHGLNTFEHQPAKVAAMEGHWETQAGAPLILFGWPDEAAEATRFALEVPKLGSLILTHDPDGVVRGLKEWRAEDRPPVAIVFWAFRAMVGLGFLMLFAVLAGAWLRLRGRLYEAGWFLRLCQWLTPAGFIAVLAGWVVTEVGRQPWLVYGLMRTAEGVTPSLRGGDVLASLLVHVAVYLVVYPAGLYYLVRLVRTGPPAGEMEPPVEGQQRPLPASRPAERAR
jgi:cytochrome bd ubiquinol oxidase subunit I